ncbi:MAG TPA: tetratricopeptide repeat protein [Pyrinomonadaceae bacterium]|nr:tetratricopeptide repeat protein [Pyrinomonadaceae bacterium]
MIITEPSNGPAIGNLALRAASFALLVLSFAGLCAGQDVARVSATWKVNRYDISATLPQAETDRNLSAKAKLDLTNVSATAASTLTLRISPAAQVSLVSLNGTTADFTKGEEKVGTGSLQRIVVRVPTVQPGANLAVTVDYKINVKDNSGLSSISPVGSQFLPLSFWYPTPNSWYFARGADYAPFRMQVTGSGQSVITSGSETAGVFDQKFGGQPFFLTGTWESVNASGVSVHLPKGAGPDAQKVAGELAALTSDARTFVGSLLGSPSDVPFRIVGVRRSGGFTGGGTILIDEGVFRRGRLDSQTAMIIADSVVKTSLGGSVSIVGDGGGVIREGLTKYIATQFLESKFGKDIADLERQRQRIAYASVSRRDAPLTIVSSLDDYYYPEVANKGAMAWRILARKIGNEEFYKGVRSAAKDASISLAELRAQFPADRELLDHLFDQVTETNLLAGLPQNVGAESRVALRNTGPVDVTVNVSATTANGERLSAPTTIRARSFGEIAFKTGNKINRVEIDPEKFYPQTDYSDDIAPRESTESDLLLSVKRAFDKQEFASAEKAARVVLRDQARFDDVRVLLGRSLLAQGKNGEAEREFRAVLEEKLPSPRSLAWANVGLADVVSKNGQAAQAAKFASDAIAADAEYGASLAARAVRNRLNSSPVSDESVKAFFNSFDKAAVSNRKADLDAMAVPGEVSKFVSGISGQTVEWKTNVLHVDAIDANNVWVEASLSIRLLNRDVETGTAVYRLTRTGPGWKLNSVDIFEVR